MMKNILLCLSGMSPQVITETLYVLLTKEATFPDEIHVITTGKGKALVMEALLDRDNGHFYKLCAEYGIPSNRMTFSESTVHVITYEGRPLDDIRTSEENVGAGDFIFSIVRNLTADSETALHASLAGGRKTMGMYLGLAMQAYGRRQDRLSHVLVNPPFENCKEFYFPPPTAAELICKPSSPPAAALDTYQRINTRDANVQLADIEFPRLGDFLGRPRRILLHESIETPRSIEAKLKKRGILTFNVRQEIINLDGYTIQLTKGQGVIYHCLLELRIKEQSINPYSLHEKHLADFIRRHYGAQPLKLETELEKHEKRCANLPEQKDWFYKNRSYINKKIRMAMPASLAEACEVISQGLYGETEYTINIAPDMIQILEDVR